MVRPEKRSDEEAHKPQQSAAEERKEAQARRPATVEQRITLLNSRTKNTVACTVLANSAKTTLLGVLAHVSSNQLSKSGGLKWADEILEPFIPMNSFLSMLMVGGLGVGFGLTLYFILSTIFSFVFSSENLLDLCERVGILGNISDKKILAKDLYFDEAETDIEALEKELFMGGSIWDYLMKTVFFATNISAASILSARSISVSKSILAHSLFAKYFLMGSHYLQNRKSQGRMLVRQGLIEKYFEEIASFSGLKLTLIPQPPISFIFTVRCLSLIHYDNFADFLAFKVNDMRKAKRLEFYRFQLDYVLREIYQAEISAFDADCMISQLPKPEMLTRENRAAAQKLYFKRVKSLEKAFSLRSHLTQFLGGLLKDLPGIKINSHYVNDRNSQPLFDMSVKFSEDLSPTQKNQMVSAIVASLQTATENFENCVYFTGNYLYFEFPHSSISLTNLARECKATLLRILYPEEFQANFDPANSNNSQQADVFETETRGSVKSKKIKISAKSHPNFFGQSALKARPVDACVRYQETEFHLVDPNNPLHPLYHSCSTKPIAYLYFSVTEEECPDGKTLAHFQRLISEDMASIHNQSTGLGVHQVFQHEARNLKKAKRGIFKRSEKTDFGVDELYCKLHTNDQDRAYCFIVGKAEVESSDGKKRKVNILSVNSVDFLSHHENSKAGILIAKRDGLADRRPTLQPF